MLNGKNPRLVGFSRYVVVGPALCVSASSMSRSSGNGKIFEVKNNCILIWEVAEKIRLSMESIRNNSSYYFVEDDENIDFCPQFAIPKHIDHGRRVCRATST